MSQVVFETQGQITVIKRENIVTGGAVPEDKTIKVAGQFTYKDIPIPTKGQFQADLMKASRRVKDMAAKALHDDDSGLTEKFPD